MGLKPVRGFPAMRNEVYGPDLEINKRFI